MIFFHIFCIFVYFCTASSLSNPFKIIGITAGCILMCVGIISIYGNVKKRRRISRRNQRVQSQIILMSNVNRNDTDVPYTISMPTKPVVVQEEQPPSYEAYMSSLSNHEQQRSDRY